MTHLGEVTDRDVVISMLRNKYITELDGLSDTEVTEIFDSLEKDDNKFATILCISHTVDDTRACYASVTTRIDLNMGISGIVNSDGAHEDNVTRHVVEDEILMRICAGAEITLLCDVAQKIYTENPAGGRYALADGEGRDALLLIYNCLA